MAHTCYSEYFQDPNGNPLGVGPGSKATLRNMYHPWRTGEVPPVAATLRDHVVNAFEDFAIGGLALLVADTDGVHQIRILHGLRKYSGGLGGASAHTGKVFGYLEDVVDGEAELVLVPNSLFGITGKIIVCTLAFHKTTLEGDIAVDLVPAQVDAALQTDTVKARMSAFVPYELGE